MRKIYKRCYDLALLLYPEVDIRCQSKHFSFVTHRNSIVAIGVNNSKKTHPIANRYGYIFNGIHSELAALIDYGINKPWDPRLTLINIRIMAYDKRTIGLSQPCDKCMKLLSDFGVRRVVFSDFEMRFHELCINIV